MELKKISFSWKFGMAGILLGLGSPYGLMLLRFYSTFHGGFKSWLLEEMSEMMPVYLYTNFGSIIVFFIFGFLLGKREDMLRAQTSKLEKLSITDSLTGLYRVHSFLLKRLDEELKRAKRYGTSLGCVFIDIDNFKAFNDVHGHLFGDRVLIKVADIIKSEMRASDILGRYGGDEFLLVLPQSDDKGTYMAAERIRNRVCSLYYTNPIALTVSAGVYTCREYKPASEIFNLADQALRRAKLSGKNMTYMIVEKEVVP